jgi:hypothetical protein
MSQTKAELLSDSFGTNATGTIPIGGIIMWSGSITSIPAGWNLCDGTSGTPDLRNRFIVGAHSDGSDAVYPNVRPGAFGGSADAVVVEHKHSITDPGHSHTQSGGGTDDDGGSRVPGSDSNGTLSNIASSSTGITQTNFEGENGTNKNLPPYYALAFIMRVS